MFWIVPMSSSKRMLEVGRPFTLLTMSPDFSTSAAGPLPCGKIYTCITHEDMNACTQTTAGRHAGMQADALS